MIKIEGWPDHPEGPATRLAVVRVASRHRPDLSDAAKQNAAQRLLNPPTTTTQPQRQRSRNDNAATTQPQRSRNAAATTKVWRGRGRGRAVESADRAGVRGETRRCMSERAQRASLHRRPANVRPIGKPKAANVCPATAPPAPDRPARANPRPFNPQGLHAPRPPRPDAPTPRRPAPRSDARDNQTGTGPSPRRSPAPRQAPESAIIPPLRAKPAGF